MTTPAATECPPDVNPRYFHYARVHGHTAEEQLRISRVEYADGGPDGANMLGFMFWMRAQWDAWWNGRMRRPYAGRSYEDHCKSSTDHAELDAQLAALGPCVGCKSCDLARGVQEQRP